MPGLWKRGAPSWPLRERIVKALRVQYCSFLRTRLCQWLSLMIATAEHPGKQSARALEAGYKNQETTSPALAAKIAPMVTHPSMFSQMLLTLSPMMAGFVVISMMSSSSGGVEKPCTMPE
jgi:hypothetical protein